MGQLQGKVTLVTGGGRGLGASVCRAFAAEGATIITADLRDELAQGVMEELHAQGCGGYALRLDVSDERDAARAIASAVERCGRLDILINNAGTDTTLPIEELSVADWDRVLHTNLRGPFLLSKAAFPIMRGQGGGVIINVASTASRRAWANASAYHASKWGLLGFSHALHVEGRPHHIKVSALISGGLRTPFIFDRFPDVDPEVLQDPANVARAIVFLATQPQETVVPEMMVLPMRETSWP